MGEPAVDVDRGDASLHGCHRNDERTIRAELLPQEAPQTVNNFVFLARQGYYDGVPFHRVMKAIS